MGSRPKLRFVRHRREKRAANLEAGRRRSVASPVELHCALCDTLAAQIGSGVRDARYDAD
jgi:hypothetical protein